LNLFSDAGKPATRIPAATLIVYALLVTSYFVTYFFRVSTSIMLPALAVQWKLEPATVGIISSLYFYTYGLAQPLSGVLNDRYGPTRIIPAALTLTGIGALMMGFAGTPLVFALGRAVTGLGVAPMLSGVLSFQSAAFPAALYATLSGITFTVGNFGSVASVGPLNAAIDRWGRGHDVVVQGPRGDRAARRSVVRNLFDAFGRVFGSSQILRVLLIWCIYFASLMAFQGLWAVSWYRAAFGITQSQASAWATLIGVGVMTGCFLGGYVWKHADSRRTAIRTSYTLYVLAWVALWFSLYTAASMVVTGWLGFVTGFLGGVCSDHLTAGLNDIVEPGHGGSTFGAMNMLIFSTIILYQSGSGFMLSLFASNTGGTHGSNSFLATFGLVVAVMLVSLVVLPGLKRFDTRPEPSQNA